MKKVTFIKEPSVLRNLKTLDKSKYFKSQCGDYLIAQAVLSNDGQRFFKIERIKTLAVLEIAQIWISDLIHARPQKTPEKILEGMKPISQTEWELFMGREFSFRKEFRGFPVREFTSYITEGYTWPKSAKRKIYRDPALVNIKDYDASRKILIAPGIYRSKHGLIEDKRIEECMSPNSYTNGHRRKIVALGEFNEKDLASLRAWGVDYRVRYAYLTKPNGGTDSYTYFDQLTEVIDLYSSEGHMSYGAHATGTIRFQIKEIKPQKILIIHFCREVAEEALSLQKEWNEIKRGGQRFFVNRIGLGPMRPAKWILKFLGDIIPELSHIGKKSFEDMGSGVGLPSHPMYCPVEWAEVVDYFNSDDLEINFEMENHNYRKEPLGQKNMTIVKR